MKETLKKPYKTSKWSYISINSIFIILLILSVIYIKYTQNLIYQNIYQNVKELSEQTATQLNLAINDQKNIVNFMVEHINQVKFNKEEEIFEFFSNELENYNFTRLVILDKQGNGKTSDGLPVNNYPNIEEFFAQKDVYLSENRPSTVSNNQVNIYSKTIILKGEEKVFMATINTSDYKTLLLRKLFGKGGTYLINNSGSVLIDSFDNIKESNANLYEYIKSSYNVTEEKKIEKIDKMADEIKYGIENTFDIELNGVTYFIHYEKLDINNWYVVTTASDDTIASDLIRLVAITTMACLGISIVIVSIVIYINVSNQNKNNKLYNVAYIDHITSLGNEHYFRENGTKYLLEKMGKSKYIMTLDINKFKALNNIYGYAFCNEILKSLGQKIEELLPQDNITCRISNDIFASIFSYEQDIKELLYTIVNKAYKLQINGIDIYVNLSIGAYKILPDDTDINKLLDKAYLARSQIKGVYHNNYYLFDETLENRIIEEQQIESMMKEALKNKEFKVFYQPKIYAKNEKVYGAEALVRWYKDGKIIPPNKFITLFEKNKFIIQLDRYIFEQVCKDLTQWKEKFGFIPNISVNVSKEQFIDENFIDKYVEICGRHNIKPNEIDLEITESATIDQNVNILNILNKIKEKGFIISIDDFGTGYSSLSMLQNMPIDIIKIDKVFIDQADLTNDENIINYIMFIAKHLETKTIIEGVETKAQVEFIKRIGGDIIQGYYSSKPLQKEEFEKYFNQNM